MNQFERQIIQKQFGKKVLRKLERSSESVPNNSKFNMFYNLIQNHYSTDTSTDVRYLENGILPTIWEESDLFTMIYTDYFKIISDTFSMSVSPLKDGIYLHILEVPFLYRNMGIGSQVMKMIRHYSNEFDIPVYLLPVPTDGENVGYEVLKNFYSKNGYQRENDSRYWKYEPNTIKDEEMTYKKVS